MSADIPTAVLLAATSGTEAIRGLFYAMKARNPRMSLEALCRRSNIPSRGYLSRVMRGERRLAAKHSEGLARAFGLEGLRASMFQALLKADEEDNASELERCRHALQIARKDLSTTWAAPLLAVQLYCLLGMSPQGVSLAEIAARFRTIPAATVERALLDLVDGGLIEREGDRFRAVQGSILFGGSSDGHSHLEFLRAAIRDAEARVGEFFALPAESHFESTIISVRREAFRKFVPMMKAELLKLQVDLENDHPDTLVHFNVQIYPVKLNV